jgi:hypothetical protein
MRLTIIAATGLAAAAATAALAASGSAQDPAAPTTLNLKGTAQRSVGFGPTHRPHQGERMGFGERVSGDDSGISRVTCTFIGTRQITCAAVLRLTRGTLVMQGLLPAGPTPGVPIAVVGGTGAYDGARGTATITNTGGGATTRIAIALRPQ